MPQHITLGFELEAVELAPTYSDICNEHNFAFHHDASIHEVNGDQPRNSGEIVSGVVVCEYNYNDLSVDTTDARRVIEQLCACAARVNKTCGFHVHLGKPHGTSGSVRARRSKWAPQDAFTWLKVGLDLEAKLYDLCPESRKDCAHTKPILTCYQPRELISEDPIGRVVARKYENAKRYCWLNLIETTRQGADSTPGRASSQSPGTVEIRMMGNTKRPDYILAWTRLCAAIAGLVAYSESPTAAILKAQFGLDEFFNAVKEAKSRVRRQAEAAAAAAAAATVTTQGTTIPPPRRTGNRD